ncbi:MAG: hypothetical protein OD817_07585 [Gammaproteobacteria bacterium]
MPPAHTRLKNNPKVSKSAVEQYKAVKAELHKLGVDTRTRYTLSHPFDREASRRFLEGK